MAKVTFEFDSTEDEGSIYYAMYGWKYEALLHDLDQRLRDTTKYGKSILDETKQACSVEDSVAEKYRELIRELIQEYNVRME
jgi:hypothetical protein